MVREGFAGSGLLLVLVLIILGLVHLSLLMPVLGQEPVILTLDPG